MDKMDLQKLAKKAQKDDVDTVEYLKENYDEEELNQLSGMVSKRIEKNQQNL